MSWILSVVQVQDGYSQAASMVGIDTRHIVLHVYNAAVIMQKQLPDGGGWSTEMLLAPGIWNLSGRTSGIQVKNAVAGIPAMVTIDALSPYG